MDTVALRDEVARACCRLVDDRGAPIEQGKPLDLAACLAICVHDVGFLQSPVRTLIPPRKSCRRAFQLRGQAAVTAVAPDELATEPRRGNDLIHVVNASAVISVRAPALCASRRPLRISAKIKVRPTPARCAASSGENAILSDIYVSRCLSRICAACCERESNYSQK